MRFSVDEDVKSASFEEDVVVFAVVGDEIQNRLAGPTRTADFNTFEYFLNQLI